MDNQLQQANITISSAEFTDWGLKIKDERGLIYNVSQYKKGTQEETFAYQAITSLPKNGLGLRKCVKFAVVPNSQGGNSRYVRIVEQPTLDQNTQPHNTMPNSLNQRPATKVNDDAWGKCKHAFLVEAFRFNLQKPFAELNTIERLAETFADMSMRKLGQPMAPTTQPISQPDDYFPEDEEIKVENIPFN